MTPADEYFIGAVAVKSTLSQTMFDDRNQSTAHHSVCGRMILCFVTKACRKGCDLPKTDAKSDMHDTLTLHVPVLQIRVFFPAPSSPPFSIHRVSSAAVIASGTQRVEVARSRIKKSRYRAPHFMCHADSCSGDGLT